MKKLASRSLITRVIPFPSKFAPLSTRWYTTKDAFKSREKAIEQKEVQKHDADLLKKLRDDLAKEEAEAGKAAAASATSTGTRKPRAPPKETADKKAPARGAKAEPKAEPKVEPKAEPKAPSTEKPRPAAPRSTDPRIPEQEYVMLREKNEETKKNMMGSEYW